MEDQPAYLRDQITLQLKSYSSGSTYLVAHGSCHDITEDWHACVTYGATDAQECALDDACRIMRGWQEFGPLGASMEVPTTRLSR